MKPIFLSRSAIEDFNRCQRKYFYKYRYDGRGIVPKAFNRDLYLGGFFHEGAAFIAKEIVEQNRLGDSINYGVIAFKGAKYINDYANETYNNLANQGVLYDGWTATKDTALVAGFVYIYGKYILPKILNSHNIIAIEKPTTDSFGYSKDYLVYESRADLILQEKESKELVVISFKTTRYQPNEDIRVELSHMYGEQEISEVYMAQQYVEKFNNSLDEIINEHSKDYRLKTEVSAKLVNMMTKMKLAKPSKVKMLYAFKGKELREGEFRRVLGNTSIMQRMITYNPIVRAFINRQDVNAKYAHTEWITNLSNKTGKGKLGKGWEPFNVFENIEFGNDIPVRITSWIDMIFNGEVQPDEDNSLLNTFWTQDDIHISDDDIREWKADKSSMLNTINSDQIISYPRNRQGCSYPDICEYLAPCRKGIPVDMDYWNYREPHHEAEKLYQLEKKGKEGNNAGNTIEKSPFPDID